MIISDFFSIKDGGKAGSPTMTIKSDGTGIGVVKMEEIHKGGPGNEGGDYTKDTFKDKMRLTVKYADLNGSKTGKTPVFTVTASCKSHNRQSVDAVQTIASIPIELEDGKDKSQPPGGDNNKTKTKTKTKTTLGPNDRINLGRRGVGLGDLQQWKPSTAANRISLRAGRTGGGTAASGGGNSPIGGGQGGGAAGGGQGGGAAGGGKGGKRL